MKCREYFKISYFFSDVDPCIIETSFLCIRNIFSNSLTGKITAAKQAIDLIRQKVTYGCIFAAVLQIAMAPDW